MATNGYAPADWFSSPSAEDTMQRATLELAEELRRQFRDRDELYADIDAVLFGELPVEIPEAYKKTAIEMYGKALAMVPDDTQKTRIKAALATLGG